MSRAYSPTMLRMTTRGVLVSLLLVAAAAPLATVARDLTQSATDGEQALAEPPVELDSQEEIPIGTGGDVR